MNGIELALALLSLTVYHEARSEPLLCQFQVALVVVNRAKFNRADVYDTVMAPKQFSWTTQAFEPSGKLRASFAPPETCRVHDRACEARRASWLRSKAVAHAVLFGEVTDFTGGARWYHAGYITAPAWVHDRRAVGRCGQHLFYN